jgi:hypothetical protein
LPFLPVSRLCSWASCLAACVLLAIFASPPAYGYQFGDTVRQIGPEETVFDWTTNRCEDNHIPDLPARAFKDSTGKVQLTMSHFVNRRMIGPSLGTVAVDCGVTMSSHGNADPAAYDDAEWISSPYTLDGSTVYSLVYDEYHGWDHPGMCSSQGQPNVPKRANIPTGVAGFDPACWYSAVTLAVSTNGGATYTHAAPPDQLVASVPYKYVADTGPYGYFTPSNIIRKPGTAADDAGPSPTTSYFYAMPYAEAYGAQQIGVCLMRTRNLSNPDSWRAWDGTGFNVRFIDPYVDPDPPEQHVCKPVAFNEIEKMNSSVTYNTQLGKYLLIGTAGLWVGEQIVYGIYYSTSSDLINWTPRELLMEAELPWSYQCGDDNPVLYPAVLQPANTTRNFEITGKKGYLYFTRLNYQSCAQTLDRDLIRIPFEFIQ